METTEAVLPVNEVPSQPRPEAFITHLLKLLREDNPAKMDRQALAELRGVLRGTPADYLRAARHVAPFLGDVSHPNDRWFYLVGGLLALHPHHVKTVSLGKAMGRLRGDSNSMDNRVLALLGTPAASLAKPLRQIISLLAQKDTGLDYARLLSDLSRWDYSEGRVQKQWARDYFRSGTKEAVPDETSDNSTNNENEDE